MPKYQVFYYSWYMWILLISPIPYITLFLFAQNLVRSILAFISDSIPDRHSYLNTYGSMSKNLSVSLKFLNYTGFYHYQRQRLPYLKNQKSCSKVPLGCHFWYVGNWGKANWACLNLQKEILGHHIRYILTYSAFSFNAYLFTHSRLKQFFDMHLEADGSGYWCAGVEMSMFFQASAMSFLHPLERSACILW